MSLNYLIEGYSSEPAVVETLGDVIYTLAIGNVYPDEIYIALRGEYSVTSIEAVVVVRKVKFYNSSAEV
jgi:hypothetical protein